MEKTENGQELSKEQEDIVDALNRKEIINQELESTTRQRDALKEEITTLAEEGEKVQKLYEERDELLDSLFGGDYGSDLENQLEKEVDLLQEQKHHMDQAHFKWRQAYMMAITYIFTDMQTTDRHEHALLCYHTTYRRSGALRQWFEQVLNTTISRDLAQLTEECKTKTIELRRERIRLIRERVKELTGKDVDYDIDMDNDAEDAAADEQVAQLFEAEKVKGQNNYLAPEPPMPPAPTPVPLNDLAPPPSNEEIFGKINELRKRHEAEVEDFKNSQAMNHARMEMGLKEKLNARRSRRNRLQAHTEEMQALGTAA
ncbi:uncharacterized protein LOC106474942, partial [Limulus polyphemus]|uniref:Uncharacterized protein LOC106474942 n=1 Tax=Limulus polyphemus TaxID=6850 RepID=A0ABM1TSP9_LIMPO